MRLLTKINLFFALMLAISLGGAVLSVWSARQAHFQIARMDLAHAVYERFLMLESHTYQLFKQFGDAMLIGDRDRGTGETMLIEAIRVDIGHIREAIGREIDLVGDEEIEELEQLAAIEHKIEQLIEVLQQVAATPEPDGIPVRWTRLSQILDGDIDHEFHTMIRDALAGELAEVGTTRDQALADLRHYQVMAGTFALLAIVSAAIGLAIMQRQLARPIRLLSDGIRRFSAGDGAHRLGDMGDTELGQIGRIFDEMAERVTAQQKGLEQAVEERTEQLGRLLEQARRSEANRRRMLADVSHELRTPLTLIRGEADIALRGEDKPVDTYKDALVRTRDAAVHTARLVDDLLLVARNEAGEVRLLAENVDLVALAGDAAETFGGGIDIVADQAEAVVRADPVRLRQALMVLLDNARNYGGDNVVLRLERTPDGYRLAVEDDGPGMGEKEMADAFERFYRGPNASARYRDGVGLGLPVARAIAEAHGGTIILENRPAGGLTAALLVPGRARLRAVS